MITALISVRGSPGDNIIITAWLRSMVLSIPASVEVPLIYMAARLGCILPWPRGTFAFFVRGSRFAVICASRFSFVLRGSRFVLRGSRFAVICASRFSFVLRGSRFAVICASNFSFVFRGSRFAVICASHFTFVLRGSRFLIRGSYFLVRASQFAVRGSWFVVVLEQGGGSAS